MGFVDSIQESTWQSRECLNRFAKFTDARFPPPYIEVLNKLISQSQLDFGFSGQRNHAAQSEREPIRRSGLQARSDEQATGKAKNSAAVNTYEDCGSRGGTRGLRRARTPIARWVATISIDGAGMPRRGNECGDKASIMIDPPPFMAVSMDTAL
ncbi:hypothetical protein [Trinickia fusca]|uniref:hypothetical protein n=1 Tax=Trinickia fusca TaxID=2419777 RepID=UPI0011C3E6BB|nr:hypothetical protein [Trinickia fusca]